MVEQRTHKPLVAGSIPASGTIFSLRAQVAGDRFAQVARASCSRESENRTTPTRRRSMGAGSNREVAQYRPQLPFGIFVMLLDREAQGIFD